MDDPLWFTLADEPCSGLGSETVLSEDGLCYRINLSPAEEVRPNNSPRLVLYLFHAVFFMLKLGTHGKLFFIKNGGTKIYLHSVRSIIMSIFGSLKA